VVDDGIWRASFMHYDLGYFDVEQKNLQPFDNRLSPMSWYDLLPVSPGWTICRMVARDRIGRDSRHQPIGFPAIIDLGAWRQSWFA
jgi:hypothetical protein